MRLGVSTSFQSTNATHWAEKLSSLGCRAAVFPLDYTAKKEDIDAYTKEAHKKDLLIAEVGAWCNPIAPDKKTREKAMERCIGQLALAEKIGANCCVNVSGALGPIWDGAYKENFSKEAWNLTVKSIQQIIDAVNPHKTFYAIEPMPWMIPADPDQYIQLIKEVNRKHFAVHMDIVNWITSVQKYFYNTQFLEECFYRLGDRIKSCHIKDVHLENEFTFNLKETACGKGNMDLERYAELANSISPDMPMIIEHLESDQAYEESITYVQQRLQTWIKA